MVVTRVGPKLSLKISTARAICWSYHGLFINYGLDHVFLGIKNFSKPESLDLPRFLLSQFSATVLSRGTTKLLLPDASLPIHVIRTSSHGLE